MTKKLKLKLTVTVEYDLNGEEKDAVIRTLEKLVWEASGTGLFTKGTDSETTYIDSSVEEVKE